jgi:hypothetical protein
MAMSGAGRPGTAYDHLREVGPDGRAQRWVTFQWLRKAWGPRQQPGLVQSRAPPPPPPLVELREHVYVLTALLHDVQLDGGKALAEALRDAVRGGQDEDISRAWQALALWLTDNKLDRLRSDLCSPVAMLAAEAGASRPLAAGAQAGGPGTELHIQLQAAQQAGRPSMPARCTGLAPVLRAVPPSGQ